jgi:hypothetical protein
VAVSRGARVVSGAAGGRDSVRTVVRRSGATEHVKRPEPTAAQAVGRDFACKFMVWWYEFGSKLGYEVRSR